MLAFGSWITLVSYNATGLVLYIRFRDRTKDKKHQLFTKALIMINDFY